ncbi:MAG: DUF3147 domain-containing protein [Planctomycetes bacterium RIFOXYD2_FULL_41_16]|nr:MAG: DUF3147 domain-containing protein [Planctomycetes bacterium RIFOXYC2_FULL_41_27]OHC07489.1 MAG: DUF3147 domain-containing protein [Planctomycetes bacterium RIFOXYD2_FULL_41_16]OHC11362.1 MAG: DUF3147 domain-containing protein [Planctomycetes bacterium RIFOXYD12_FULL_42_12]
MQLKTFILHFILGGTIVSVVTFLGSQGKGMLAAFVATFPTMTALTFALIYSKGGQVATVNYAKGLLFMTPPWIIYVLCLIFLLPRWGFVKSLLVGVLTYMIFAGIVSIVMKHLGRG